MRIIAGEKKSRILCAPPGSDTRPTADKVKEALFSILGARVIGARVLDLYSGSGALSLESLSRGAEFAVLVDRDRKAAEAIRKNITNLDYGKNTLYLQMSDREAVNRLKREGRTFDLVFLDPPYRMNTGPVCRMLAEAKLIDSRTCVVTEHLRDNPPDAGEDFVVTDTRHYGITGITLLELRSAGADVPGKDATENV